MKKLVLILVVLSVVFASCASPIDEPEPQLDGPTARLQGRWYILGNSGPVNDWFLEFTGNIMRYYNNGYYGEYADYHGPFTCTETVISVTFSGDYYDSEFFTHTIPYTIQERTIWGVTYKNVLSWGSSSTYYPEGATWIKLDTPPPDIN